MPTTTYDPIASYTFAGAAASYTFTNIPQTYTDLRFVLNVAGDTLNAFVKANFNGDVAANYSGTTLYANGTTSGSTRFSAGGGSQIWVTDYVSFSQTLGESLFTFDVMNYSNSTTYKSCLTRGSRTTSTGSWYGSELQVVMWRNTNSVTSIAFSTSAGNISAGSTITMYGIL